MRISVLTAWKIETNETTILESEERVELWLVKNGVPHSLLLSCPHANKEDLLKAVEEIKNGNWKYEFTNVER